MKTIILFVFSLVVLVSCKEPVKQYTTTSPEIETIKTLHQYYMDNNYDGLTELYAEDAQIFDNSLEPTSVSDIIREGKEGRNLVVGYDFPDGIKCEMIINDEGEKWVNSWAVWSGSLQNSDIEIQVPIISRFLFEDGKIIQEFSYWDNLPAYAAFEELATEQLDNLQEIIEENE